MKKLSFIAIAVAAMAFAGCQLEREIDSPRNLGNSTVVASLGQATRSFLEANGEGESASYEVYWAAPDQILIAFAGVSPSLYTSQNSEPAQTAAFRGTFPKGEGDLYGIYPAEDGNEVDADGNISIAFHAEQTAVAGSYDPLASPAVAVSESHDLSFQNVCGLLALKVGWDDATKIVLKATTEPVAVPKAEPEAEEEGIEIPGGVLTVVMGDAPEIAEYSEGLTEITLLAPSGGKFSPDETYYMVVPPCSFPYGASFIVTRAEKEETIEIESSVSVERAKVHEVPVLYVEPIVLVESIEPEADAMEIEYESEPFTIDITVGPEDADDKSVSWESSNPDVVTVDEDGLITVVGYGEATITVTANDGSEVSATIEITVLLPKNRISYDGGETWAPLKSAAMRVYPEYDTDCTGLNIAFSSDPEADWDNLVVCPPGDWFGLDIAEEDCGEIELPGTVDSYWSVYMSWKDMSVTDEEGYAILYSDSDHISAGSLNIVVDEDYETIELEAEIETDGEHVIVIYSGEVSTIIDEEWEYYMGYYHLNPVENPASEEEIEEFIAGSYEMESFSVNYKEGEYIDEISIEALPHNTPGAILISGSFADISPIQCPAFVDKIAEGEYEIHIPAGNIIFEGLVPRYDEEYDAFVELFWSNGSDLYVDDIVIAVSGDHELDLDNPEEYEYLGLIDYWYGYYYLVDFLDPSSVAFTYQGSGPSPAPALFKAPRAPRLEKGKGMLKMPESKPIKFGKKENLQLNHIRNAK